MDKKQKKNRISEKIDLGNGRFKDHEVDKLLDICDNYAEYDGLSKTKKTSFSDWSSDGKYTRNETRTYRVGKNGDGKICISEDYSYVDDDGQTGGSHTEHSHGRDILRLLDIFS